MYDFTKSTWLNPAIEYLFNDDIIEYDIKDAGFNIIKQFKLLPVEKIKELSKIEHKERHIAIGKIQRDDKIFSKALMDKFAEVRHVFISANELSDSRIISVKKDAFFVIGQCEKLKFGNIEFIPKHSYSSYIRFVENNNIEVLYSNNNVEIKGISDGAINRHRLYMYDFICTSMRNIEDKNPISKRNLIKFINDYKQHNLDDMYYIEFNNRSDTFNPDYNFLKILIPLVRITIKEFGYE